jgi:hypothetical protein
MRIVITRICSPLCSVIPEMCVRMVVLLLFHIGCADFVNEDDFQCTYDGDLLKFCCPFESSDDFCERLREKYESDRNTTLSDELDHERCCVEVQPGSDELKNEVNDPN